MELDDQVVNNLAAAAKLLDQLQKNPETRKPLLQMVKKVHPGVSIPELDAAKPLEDKIDALGKKLDAMELSGRQKDQNAELAAARNRLRSQFGFTDEGITALEKFMLETGTQDHEVARKAMAADRKTSEPARPAFNLRNKFVDDDKAEEGWLTDPDRQLDNELNKAFEAIALGQAG